MKKLLYSSLVILGTLLGSCSDDYLETKPENSPSPSDLFATVENAQYAINGLGRLHSNQFISTQGFSGEGGMIVWYGEFPGNDMNHNRHNSTWYNYANLNYAQSSTSTHSLYPWLYNYKIIANANEIINNIDGAVGDQASKDFLKAQAIVYRANAYLWLVQVYSKRWCDSNGGQTRGVVLRTGHEPDDLECATLAESYQFIYDDLDEAVRLFTSSGKDRPSGAENIWLPNLNVAHAVYARAALCREDWKKANDEAEAARKGFSLMTSTEYRAGFNAANQEWIWMAYNDNTQTLSYYGPFAYLASNSAATVTRSYGNVISNDLINQIPEEDSRRWLYGLAKDGDKNTVNQTTGRVTKGGLYDRYTKGEYYDRYCHTAAMSYYLNAVMKFQIAGGVADGCMVLYRAAEMYYTQAEALYELGRETDARNLLIDAVKPYQPNYTCTKSGTELRDEIRLYRRFDLLGEGHNFFDFKRWKLPVVRKTWAEGGTWPAVFAGDGHGEGATGGNFGPNDKNNWCFYIPSREIMYNKYVVWEKEPDNWAKGKEQAAGTSGDNEGKKEE